MGGQDLFSSFGTLIGAVFLIASLYIYLALLRQVGLRPPEASLPSERRFGMPEVVLALFLSSWFALFSFSANSAHVVNLQTRDLIANVVVALGLIAFVGTFLRLRGFNLWQLTGLTRLSFRRAFFTGLVLVIVAYPLIFVADRLTAQVLGTGSSRQGIIELFSGSQSLLQRVIIIVLAVAVAPCAEEFIFRFFLYGVVRRYGGRAIGLIVSSLLFAAVHAHLPSFAPLFVLGSCFTLAYEWSGSLLVSMTMHSLFNSLTLVALAFPQTAPS